MDVEERLTWLDQEYLSKYGEKEVDSKISMQKAFDAPHEIYKKYSISTSESEEDNTYLSWNVSVGTSSDVRLVTAMAILEYALLSALICVAAFVWLKQHKRLQNVQTADSTVRVSKKHRSDVR